MKTEFVTPTANHVVTCMHSTKSLWSRCALALAFAVAAVSMPAQGQTFTTLYTFTGPDGYAPTAGLFRDSAGNLYGTTFYGGANGLGVVFKIDTNNNETVLYSFAGGSDGANPYGGVIRDSAGNLYGMTTLGGSPTCQCGIVFKVSSSGTETVLYRFRGGTDGAVPWSGLTRDSEGNLYGTTTSGGYSNYGTVFKVNSSGTESVLYRFRGPAAGGGPVAGVIRDSDGNLYGIQSLGPLFKIDTSNHFTVLWDLGAVVLGDLSFCYGSSICGTTYQCEGGSVWEFTQSGEFTVLYSALDYNDGCSFAGSVVQDKAGNLFGAASAAGEGDSGTLFEVFAGGGGQTIYTFGSNDGYYPQGDLVMDKEGNIYGTTQGAPGTVWKFKP